jgi:hypothetical protein
MLATDHVLELRSSLRERHGRGSLIRFSARRIENTHEPRRGGAHDRVDIIRDVMNRRVGFVFEITRAQSHLILNNVNAEIKIDVKVFCVPPQHPGETLVSPTPQQTLDMHLHLSMTNMEEMTWFGLAFGFLGGHCRANEVGTELGVRSLNKQGQVFPTS